MSFDAKLRKHTENTNIKLANQMNFYRPHWLFSSSPYIGSVNQHAPSLPMTTSLGELNGFPWY